MGQGGGRGRDEDEEVTRRTKILESLLEVRPFTFALDVAALASRCEYLNSLVLLSSF